MSPCRLQLDAHSISQVYLTLQLPRRSARPLGLGPSCAMPPLLESPTTRIPITQNRKFNTQVAEAWLYHTPALTNTQAHANNAHPPYISFPHFSLWSLSPYQRICPRWRALLVSRGGPSGWTRCTSLVCSYPRSTKESRAGMLIQLY